DRAFVELEHVGNGGVERDSARAAACLQVSEDEHGVVEVADVRGFDTRPPQGARFVPELAQPGGTLPDPVSPLDASRYVRDELHFRVQGRGPCPRTELPAIPALDARAHHPHVLVRNKSLHLEESLLLLVDAGLCPLRGSTQRRSGPVGACQFHPSRVTTAGSSWALLRNTRSPAGKLRVFIRRG